jgi:hypothetical protein
MFWEGRFSNGDSFELVLKYGTVILFVSKKEIVIGYVSDFPDVADVISKFELWVTSYSEDLK